jgi:hypothetical protein
VEVFMAILGEGGGDAISRTLRLALAGGHVQAARAHHLVGAEQVGHGAEAAPHVHQAAEGEQQEDRHAQQHVGLEVPVGAGHQRGIGLHQVAMPCR